MSSTSKIHPIYVALDANQYNRAIKLCLALPKDNLLAQALLAHAYNKSMQRYKAILVLQSIVGKEGFQELQLECQYSKEAWDIQQAAANAPSASAPVAVAKKAKKGKKKPVPASKPNSPSEDVEPKWSLAEHLESPPAIDENWQKLPPTEHAITDETTIGTLVITLQNLRLFLTSYQLYCWAAAKVGTYVLLRKAFLHGLGVVVSPQYASITKTILSNLQVLALQLARVNKHTGSTRLSTSWVAQTALWQLTLVSSASTDAEDPKEKRRFASLPRLAENLASKCVGEPIDGELASARREVYFLYLRILEYQCKWQEMLDLLKSDVFKARDETGVSMAPKQQVLEKQSRCLQKLEKFGSARLVLEALLEEYPDNFLYWKQHLECALAEHEEDENAFKQTEQFAEMIVEKSKKDKYPKRAPLLIHVEIATKRIDKVVDKRGDMSSLLVAGAIKAIMKYGDLFGSTVSCTFTDLEPYLCVTLEYSTDSHNAELLKWLQGKMGMTESEHAAERRRQQRGYIFSVKMTHRIIAKHGNIAEAWMPDWTDLVRTWKKTHTSDEPNQKESLPGDDLILLAIQQILRGEPDENDFFVAAVLIEAGIKNSPSNGTLKIAALDIYSGLNAASRAWEIYQELQIKHIQLDTCTYLILPILLSGGFYQEILKVSKGLLMLHTSVVRETCEFTGRAMDNGILSKADEFIVFQREKMTSSLTALEATGLILDSAPFFAHDTKDATLGVAHGIVGSESDFERATEMVIEVRNPYGALSLLHRALNAESLDFISDNRDQSILSYEVLYQRKISTREDIINDSIRRGHNHNMLIRSALCVHFTKGPKKGKMVKPGGELLKCCSVLLKGVEAAKQFCAKRPQSLRAHLMGAQIELCQTLLVVNSGIGLGDGIEDILDEREKQALRYLQSALTGIKQAVTASRFLEGETDVAFVSRLLPVSVVPLFACFRMCADVLEAFGWGRRKVKTKQVSADFAKVAAEFAVFLKAMQAAFSSPKVFVDSSPFDDISDIIQEALVAQTRARIDVGREETQVRVRPHIISMSAYLDGFEDSAALAV